MKLGPYEILAELGRGGMGRVVRARHERLGVVRAIKLLHCTSDVELIARFRREAEVIARAGGPGVVPVHDSGVEGGTFWYAMDLMPGGSLRDLLRAEGALPWRRACELASAVGRSLGRCHGAGVVHRDVKPENVLLDESGTPRLADFGCAADLGASRSLTDPGTILGTLPYAAPEQLAGERAGPEADVFALAAVLHELVSGERPHAGSSPLAIGRSIATRKPSTAFASRGAPLALDRLLDRTFSLDPRSRPSDGSAFAREIERVLAVAGGENAETTRRGPSVALAALSLVAIAAVSGAVLGGRAPVSRDGGRESSPAPVARPPAPSPASAATAGHGASLDSHAGERS